MARRKEGLAIEQMMREVQREGRKERETEEEQIGRASCRERVSSPV